MRRLVRSRLLGVLLVLVLLGVWEVAAATGMVDTPSVPRMSAVMATWWELMVTGRLPGEMGVSLYRSFSGYVIAVVCGIAIGLGMGYWRTIYNLLEPLTELLRPIPSPAYIPLAILFFGLGDQMKIFVVAFSCFFPVLLNTFGAIRAVDPVLINTGRTFKTSRRRMIGSILLPAAVPGIFTGMRVALAISLILVVIAEMVASNSGIGYFILNSQRLFQVRDMYAGILTLALVGYLLNQLFVMVERRILRWQPKSG